MTSIKKIINLSAMCDHNHSEVARKLGVSRQAVNERLLKHGLAGNGKRPKYTNAELLEFLKTGDTIAEIEVRYGADATRLKNLADKHGIKRIKYKQYTYEQLKPLYDHYRSSAGIGRHLGTYANKIQRNLRRLGII